MATSKGTVERYNATRGLITEASPTTFPADAAVDINNMEITAQLKTQRRLGLRLEPQGGTLFSDFDFTDKAKGVYGTFLWKLVHVGVTYDVRVMQVGRKIKLLEDTSPLSDATVLLELDISTAPYKAFKSVTTPSQYTASAGFLLITGMSHEIIAVTNSSTEAGTLALTAEVVTPRIRTQELLGEPYDGETSVGALTVAQEFDLRNSGWPYSTACAPDAKGSENEVTPADPVHYFFGEHLAYPTPYVLFNAMKLSNSEEVVPLGSFSPWEIGKLNFGSTTPPIGRFIHSAYSFSALGLMGDQAITSGQADIAWGIRTRPTCCGFLNGHAVYGDIGSDNNARLLLTQLVRNVRSLSKCHAEADPTAEEVNDLVATDGAVLTPVGMGQPLAIHQVSRSLLIFCSNGVWQLKGASGAFSATDYTIDKLVDVDFSSPSSIAIVDDTAVFFAEQGIYMIARNEFGDLVPRNLTQATIETLYFDYGPTPIERAIAAYSEDERYVYWLIPRQDADNRGDCYDILVLNLVISGFFVYSFSADNGRPALHLPLVSSNIRREIQDVPVTVNDGTSNVFTSTGALVTVQREVEIRSKSQLRLFASYTTSGGTLNSLLCEFGNTDMQDWAELGAPYTYDYPSYIEFAYVAPQSMSGGVAAPYIHSFFEPGRTSLVKYEYLRVRQNYIQILEKL